MSRRRRSKPRVARPPGGKGGFDAALQLHAAGRLDDAEAAYRKLLAAAPKDARLHHLLGRVLHQRGQLGEAIERLQAAVGLCPDDQPALNDLGLLYKEAGAFDDAVRCYQRVLELDPENAAATHNLGLVYKGAGRLKESVATLQKAAELTPEDADVHTDLGNTLKRMDDLSGAEAAYREALAINPKALEVYPNLAAVLRRLDRLDDAAEVFEQWLEHDPDNAVARHLQNAGTGDSAPARASEDYVRDVFDEFAETFDQHLGQLGYQGPKLIASALEEAAGAGLEVLDAGCGTGLCGELLRPLARKLVGVDLSSKMLDRARALELYDELVEADLVAHLVANPARYDLIASADTFGYFGQLEAAMAAVRGALKPGGVFVATFETDDAESPTGYRLMKSGRYRHTRAYLDKAWAPFEVQSVTPGTLRTEAKQPVRCVVVRARWS